MNLKNLVQIFLIIIIILISYLFYKNYFTKDINIEKQITVVEADKELLSTEQTTNIIENLEYSSLDRDGNKYTIKANYAEVTSDNENILILTKVIGIIYLKEKGEIFIYSDKAEYNKINFDTKFYNNVKVDYDDSEIFSDNTRKNTYIIITINACNRCHRVRRLCHTVISLIILYIGGAAHHHKAQKPK